MAPCRHSQLDLCRGETAFCKRCRKDCISCKGCAKVFQQVRIRQYDGERCSKCFDQHQKQTQKGLWRPGDKRKLCDDFGFFKNETEWVVPYQADEGKDSRLMMARNSLHLKVHEQVDHLSQDEDYDHTDGFCVPDDEEEKATEALTEPKKKRRKRVIVDDDSDSDSDGEESNLLKDFELRMLFLQEEQQKLLKDMKAYVAQMTK